MRSNANFFSDEKFRSIFFQTLVVGLFALGLFFVISTTSYNLEKRNIATGWRFRSRNNERSSQRWKDNW